MPNLLGSQIDTLQKFLNKYDLTYKIIYEIDNWQLKKSAGTVLTQIPKSGKEVKEGREVLITITAKKPTSQAKMPQLVDKRLDDAVEQLKKLGLDTGKITYRAFLGENIIMEQRYKGKQIQANTYVSIGSKIDLYRSIGIIPPLLLEILYGFLIWIGITSRKCFG